MTTGFKSFAIIPAAGQSQRMGATKLLLPWQGGTLIEHVVGAWRQSDVDELIVVVSPDNQPLIDACRRLPCRLLVPTTPPPEMKASVCRGLEFISREFAPTANDVWLVAPADLPEISPAAVNTVLAAHNLLNPSILVPCHNARRGHPALFPWALAAAVFALRETESLKDLIARSPVRELEVADSGAFEDLDTPDDYRRLHNRHNR